MKTIGLLGFGAPTEKMNQIWTDEQFLKYVLQIEQAWIKAAVEARQAPENIILEFDQLAISIQPSIEFFLKETKTTGRSIAPIIEALAKDSSIDLQKVIHLGLTTQDVIDGSLNLMRRDSLKIIYDGLLDLKEKLVQIARDHEKTPMLARTNGMGAAVSTFGLFAAEASSEIYRGIVRIKTASQVINSIQLNGAIGLSEPFGHSTTAVRQHAARQLSMYYDPAATAASRDQIAHLHLELVLCGKSLGRIAQTIAEMQSEAIGELSEHASGFSSAMPQKQNPRCAERVLTISSLLEGCAIAALAASQTKHHRSGQTWMLEWSVSQDLMIKTDTLIDNAKIMLSRLEVNAEIMRHNIDNLGRRAYADRLFVAFSKQIGRDDAKKVLESEIFFKTLIASHEERDLLQAAYDEAVSIKSCITLARSKQQKILLSANS